MSTALLANSLRIATSTATAAARPGLVASAAAVRLHALLQQFLDTTAQTPPHHRQSTDKDAIDCFTNDLVVRKANKWRSLKAKLITTADTATAIQPAEDPSSTDVHISLRLTARRILADLQGDRAAASNAVRHCLDMRTLRQQHIDQLLQSARRDSQTGDFYALLDECVRWRKMPSAPVFLQCMDYLSGDDSGRVYVQRMAELCAELEPELYAEHAELAHFEARAQWHRGDRVAALHALAETYSRMRAGRLVRMADELRGVLCEVAELAIGDRQRGETGSGDDDEQVLEAVERTAAHLAERFGENQMLQHWWRRCFESEWFRHQQRAQRLFEGAEEVRQFVGQQTSVMCYAWLQAHNVDAVHRLIELLLRYEMRSDCRTCLSFLFDYQYWRRDLRACSEIMRSSLDMEAPLSEAHNQKLLNLLLGTAPAQRKKPAAPAQQPTFKMQF